MSSEIVFLVTWMRTRPFNSFSLVLSFINAAASLHFTNVCFIACSACVILRPGISFHRWPCLEYKNVKVVFAKWPWIKANEDAWPDFASYRPLLVNSDEGLCYSAFVEMKCDDLLFLHCGFSWLLNYFRQGLLQAYTPSVLFICFKTMAVSNLFICFIAPFCPYFRLNFLTNMNIQIWEIYMYIKRAAVLSLILFSSRLSVSAGCCMPFWRLSVQ